MKVTRWDEAAEKRLEDDSVAYIKATQNDPGRFVWKMEPDFLDGRYRSGALVVSVERMRREGWRPQYEPTEFQRWNRMTRQLQEANTQLEHLKNLVYQRLVSD